MQNHKRRQSRFEKFVHAEMQREGDRVLHVDPRTVVDLLEDQRAAEANAETGDKVRRKRPTNASASTRMTTFRGSSGARCAAPPGASAVSQSGQRGPSPQPPSGRRLARPRARRTRRNAPSRRNSPGKRRPQPKMYIVPRLFLCTHLHPLPAHELEGHLCVDRRRVADARPVGLYDLAEVLGDKIAERQAQR